MYMNVIVVVYLKWVVGVFYQFWVNYVKFYE